MSSQQLSLLLLVTGASRGLGRAICLAFCEDGTNLGRIHAMLIARSSKDLQTTSQVMQQQVETLATSKSANQALSPPYSLELNVTIHTMDLSNLEQLDANLDLLFQQVPTPATPFDRIVVINNAGALGHVGRTLNSPSLASMKESIDFNVTSALWWSVRMARHFHTSSSVDSLNNSKVTLVNVSSLVAIQDFPTMAIYSAGKAARDRFHSVLAVEEKDTKLKVLNYAPGPLETDMSTILRNSTELDDSLQPFYQQPLIDPLNSARRLVLLLLKGTFTSGQHVDYYDLV